MSEDILLIHNTLNGNAASFGMLIDKYRTPVFNLIFRLTGNYHETEDLFQDVFIKAYKSLGSFSAGNSFFSWIYTIALNHTRNHIKHKKIISFIPMFKKGSADDNDQYREIEFSDSEPGPEKKMEKMEDLKLIQRILLELPFKYREMLVLRYQQDLNYEEISKITGLPMGTVENRLYRAGRMLEAAYKKLI